MDDKTAKTYKKYTLLLLIVTVVALVVTAAALSMRGSAAVPVQGNPEKNDTNYYTPNPVLSQGTEALSSAPESELFLVTIHEGKIGVFRVGETEPFLVSDTQVYLLPGEDIALLRRGISAQSLTDVRRILEDYE